MGTVTPFLITRLSLGAAIGTVAASGRSGKVGIKSFFADRIQSAEMTDESFDPKFPIELTKAGVGYFARSFTTTPTRAPAARPLRTSYGPKYVIQCPYCSKQFTRNSGDTKLNKHKDRFGNRCYGSVGFIVEVR